MIVTMCTKISLVPRPFLEQGCAKMALDTCPLDQLVRNFDARISEVRLYRKMAIVVQIAQIELLVALECEWCY